MPPVLTALREKNVEKGVEAVILFRMGEIHEALDRPEQAIGCYINSMNITPNLLEAHERTVKILLRRSRWEEALRSLSRFGEALTSLELRTQLESKIQDLKASIALGREQS